MALMFFWLLIQALSRPGLPVSQSTGELNISEQTLDEALSVITSLGAMACIHAEDEAIRLECEAHLKSDFSPQSHSRARPPMCEALAVEKAIALVKKISNLMR